MHCPVPAAASPSPRLGHGLRGKVLRSDQIRGTSFLTTGGRAPERGCVRTFAGSLRSQGDLLSHLCSVSLNANHACHPSWRGPSDPRSLLWPILSIHTDSLTKDQSSRKDEVSGLTKAGRRRAVCGKNVPFSHLSSLSRGRKAEDQGRGIKERERLTEWGRERGGQWVTCPGIYVT